MGPVSSFVRFAMETSETTSSQSNLCERRKIIKHQNVGHFGAVVCPRSIYRLSNFRILKYKFIEPKSTEMYNYDPQRGLKIEGKV